MPTSIAELRNRLEQFLGHSHQCLNCRNTFLQHEDGCPYCGSMAPAILLLSSSNRKNDGKVWYEIAINKRTGEVEYTFPEKEVCTCPKECDCQHPEGGEVLGISNHCPEHNYNPIPAPDCLAHQEKEAE